MPDLPRSDNNSSSTATSASDIKTNVNPAKPTYSGSPAMASKPSPPIARIEQTERCDDSLACVAMLSRMSLDKVTELAYGLGYPKFGPAYVTDEILTALAMKTGNWVAKNYKDFVNFDLLPPIAILYVDYSEELDVGRTVLWLRPPATVESSKAPTSLQPERVNQSPLKLAHGSRVGLGRGYVIDPAYWVKPEQQVLTGACTLHFVPGWFMEFTQGAKTSK